MWFAGIFSQPIAFHPQHLVFLRTKGFNSEEVQFTNFSFYGSSLSSLFLALGPEDLLLLFSKKASASAPASYFTFKYLIHFELIFT